MCDVPAHLALERPDHRRLRGCRVRSATTNPWMCVWSLISLLVCLLPIAIWRLGLEAPAAGNARRRWPRVATRPRGRGHLDTTAQSRRAGARPADTKGRPPRPRVSGSDGPAPPFIEVARRAGRLRRAAPSTARSSSRGRSARSTTTRSTPQGYKAKYGHWSVLNGRRPGTASTRCTPCCSTPARC